MSTVSQLNALQEIDSQLQELTEFLGDLPRKVEELKAEETVLQKSVEEGKNRIIELMMGIDKSELTADEISGKIDKLKNQLFLVTTNKQYDALQHEIDYLKGKLDEAETQILEYSEEKETLEEKLKSEEANLESLSSDLVERREKLGKLLEETSEEKKKLAIRREDQRKKIEEIVLHRYDRIHEAREGLAVVSIESGACGGCGSRVPPQILNEIRSGKQIYNCDICSRFLFWEES